ncbi:unnamed protein product [Prunus brigantina]
MVAAIDRRKTGEFEREVSREKNRELDSKAFVVVIGYFSLSCTQFVFLYILECVSLGIFGAWVSEC